MRLIGVIVITVVVAIVVGILVNDQLADAVQGLFRWLMITGVIILAILVAFIGSVIRYRKPKSDIALVRTGGRREKITITGGMWINTIIHEVKEISLNTMRIEVVREAQEALITVDLNRADTEVVFYLKVEPIADEILRAAQALGDKSMTPETVRELIEPKLEGALRSVAAETEIQDLLQKRQEFAENVQRAVGLDLQIQNGLTLETVSIIRIDQTPVGTLDTENRFDAVGIRTIIEITADQAREKERIVQEKEVAIVRIDVDARIQRLEAEQAQALAESDQQRNIAVYAAEREADTLKFQFEMEQGVQEREYEMKQEVERARITQEQVVQEREIEMNMHVELARVEQGQVVAEREIEMNLVVETKQIEQSKAVELAEIERILTVEMRRIEQEETVAIRDFEKTLAIEKARIAQEEGVELRDIERTLVVETSKIVQEQQVQLREIEKNLVVETGQINQSRQVELAEINKTQVVQEREMEKTLFVERARIAQEEGVGLRDIERLLAVETSRFAQEQQVQQREIEKNLVVEAAQINQSRQVELTEIQKILTVEQAHISQELTVTLRDEDRKIDVAHKQQVTALAERDKLLAQAEEVGAQVTVSATQQVGEAEWQRDVAVIGAEAQAQPIERLADAVLAEARAKAQGEMAHLEARNVAEQRVLVQEAILELIETSPELVEGLMKPVERIDSIKILDMGGSDNQGGVNRSNMGRLANTLLDTGAISPILKELFNFADVDAQKITDKIAQYLAELVNGPSDS